MHTIETKCKRPLAILQQIWPYVDQAVGEEIKRQAGPLLEASKPPFLGKLELSLFTLGSTAPTITGAKTYPQPQSRVRDIIVRAAL